MQTEEDPPPRRAVADIQMRLVVKVEAYAQAGQIMDEIADAAEGLLAGHEGKFDFVGFQTHPCKTAQMARRATALTGVPVDADDFGPLDIEEPPAF